MPYFNNNKDINVLFIHIPKTGGQSISAYLTQKYSVDNCKKSFHGLNLGKNIKVPSDHFLLNTILTFYKDKLIFKNLKILSVVRNPYSRRISEIFFRKKISEENINDNDIQEKIETIITNDINSYLENKHHDDNHFIPQYKFLCDKNEKIYNNIDILKFENLNNNMKKIGFHDFNVNINKSEKKHDYMYYLNKNSINLINKIYKKDFELFGYEMIQV
jgi:hypothetical protein